MVTTNPFGAAVAPVRLFEAWTQYLTDAAQRTLLFWDVFRKRGNDFLEHAARGEPPVLVFDQETILDGRTLDRPCNYALLHIRPAEGVTVDPTKRPIVVVDPRAGQGPGVGGFKLDSEVGFALRAGHPVYFISFYPEPVSGQTLLDIGDAEARFIEEVGRRHPRAPGKPCVIGNCQAGWAVAALSAVRPEIVGPVILAGAPLSYWAGADSQNPMRYDGGLLGGSWLASFIADAGHGIYDGAWLVQNFESLNPAHTLWQKPYDLYAHIDTEEQRFLDFERWWGGYYLLTKEEMKEIIDNLFIGNKLAQGLKLPGGQVIDLKNIASPLVVFASWGDNITPPEQALDWIIDVYGHESAIIDRGHVIVYLLAQDVGHLGIFVSGRVAREEHRELINVLDMLGELPPGLYEMVIEQRPAHGLPEDIDRDTYTVRFETRTMADLRALNPDHRAGEALFSTIKQVSALNEWLYEWLWGPAVRSLSSESGARLLRWLHPLRMRHYLVSDLNPFFVALPLLASYVRQHRRAAPEDNPFVRLEQSVSKVIGSALSFAGDLRDGVVEQAVRLAYGPLGLSAVFPPEPLPEIRAEKLAEQRGRAELAELRDQFDRGGLAEAVARMLVAVIRAKGAIDRRSFVIADELSQQHSGLPALSEADIRAVLAKQALLMELDPEAALKALPRLLPSRAQRERATEIVARIMRLEPKECDPEAPLAKRVGECLDLPPGWHKVPAAAVRGGAA